MTSSYAHVISKQVAAPRTFAAVHAQVPYGAVPRVFAQYLDQVYAAQKAGAVHLDGENVFMYRDVPGVPAMMHVAFGVGLTAPFAGAGSVVPTLLPGGDVATTTLWGSYTGIRAAHDAVIAWCGANGYRRMGVSWEVYGHWTSDEARLRTDIFHLLAPAG